MVATPTLVVFALIAIAMILFVSEIVPNDVTAIGIIVTLAVLEPITGVTHQIAISGFASSATITIVAMFMLSAAIHRTGIVQRLGYRLAEAVAGDSRRALMATVGVTGPLAGFVNNTPIVAIFIPMISDLADNLEISPSKLLLPLSYAAILGGTLTLIGTSTNLIASDYAVEFLGRDPIGMFEFTALGAVVLLVGIVYLITVGPWLLPARIPPGADLIDEFDLADFLTNVRVRDREENVGLRVRDIESQWGVRILGIRRKEQGEGEDPIPSAPVETDGGRVDDNQNGHGEASNGHGEGDPAPGADAELFPGDVLTIHGSLQTVNRFVQEHDGLRQLVRDPVTEKTFVQANEDGVLAKLLIPPDSELAGRTIADTHLRSVYDTNVLAVRRNEELIRRDLSEVKLRKGDFLLVRTVPSSIGYFYDSDDLVVVEDTQPGADPDRDVRRIPTISPKAPIAVAIMVGVVASVAFGFLPIVIAALAGVVGMIVSGCLTMTEAYDAVSWNVIFLLAGVIPLGFALEATGGAELIANGLVATEALLPLVMVMFVLYVLTGLLANVITPVASAVLMIPVAIEVAAQIGASGFSFLLVVMFASATYFMTPIGYQTNLMVYGPGGYEFMDFLRIGAPLQLLLAVVSTIGIVLIWGT